MIRKLNPPHMDFPTPGSPIRRGLFFTSAQNLANTFDFFSRPTTGSNFPSSAISVKSLPKLSKTGVLDF
jgi:hypothetical protein